MSKELVARHPDMATGWVTKAWPAPLPSSASFITAMSTDLYGGAIYIAMGNQVWKASLPTSAWTLVYKAGAGETIGGIADSHGGLYVLVLIGGALPELRVVHPNGSSFRIGNGTGLLSIADVDGYLVGTTTSSRLVTRMGDILVWLPGAHGDALAEDNAPPDNSTVHVADLTWMDIGAAPAADAFAIGHFFGRAYTLSGSYGHERLRWRGLVPQAGTTPLDHGRLLFYHAGSGACAVGRFLGSGDYENQHDFVLEGGFTHVLRVNDGLILFYSSGTGDARLGRIAPDGTWSDVGAPMRGAFGKWSIVVSDGAHVLFYRNGSKEGYVGRFDPVMGAYINTYFSDQFYDGWLCAAATWGIAAPGVVGNGKYIVFYAADGTLAVGRVDAAGQFQTVSMGKVTGGADTLVPAGQMGVFLCNKKTGFGEYGELSLAPTPIYSVRRPWAAAHPTWVLRDGAVLGAGRNGLTFFYDPATADAAAGGFSNSIGYLQLIDWLPDAGFRKGWTHIAGV